MIVNLIMKLFRSPIMSMLRKVLAVLIVIYLAYGWLNVFLDNSQGASESDSIESLTAEDMAKIRGDEYR